MLKLKLSTVKSRIYFPNLLYKNVLRAYTLQIFLNHTPSKTYFSEVFKILKINILLNILRNILIPDIFSSLRNALPKQSFPF